jgi:MFS family permease
VTLWQNRPFIRLWIAQILSNAGTEITKVALPLTAVLVLGATPAQMALLAIVGSLPNLLFGLFAGVWVDRSRRGPILVRADLGRAIVLGSIPVAVLFWELTFLHLALVIFFSSTFTIFFTIASVSILPSLVAKERLVEANSKLAFTDSLIGIAGPGAASGLIQLVSAPKAIIVDAASYLLSALCLGDISAAERPIQQPLKRPTLLNEIVEGVQELVRTPLLQILTLSSSIGTVGGGMQQTVLMIFLVRSLELSPTAIGLIFTFGSAGTLIGSALACRIARLIGIGRATIFGNFLWALGTLAIPLAGWQNVGPDLLFLCLGQGMIGSGATIWSINQMSIRQHITPADRFGRATAARRFLIFGTAAIGALLGGYLAIRVGLRTTLVLGGVGFSLGCLLLLFSPVRRLHHLTTV